MPDRQPVRFRLVREWCDHTIRPGGRGPRQDVSRAQCRRATLARSRIGTVPAARIGGRENERDWATSVA
jgi:hypothetical protein